MIAQQARRPAQIYNLPPQPTPFMGRTEEVAEVTHLLADPACQLLTLVGAGGIGKTRLAIQAATEMLADFTHGVFFIPLQPVQSTNFLASTVADALKFALSGQEATEIQLLNHLRDKKMLLLLDNFEQLLEGGADLLIDILQTAPAVKLLVTSQEVLNLQEEWLYSVQGLEFPPLGTEPQDQVSSQRPRRIGEGEDKPLAAYSAVQLFVERARRVRRDFSLADEQADVAHICQLVEGVPLAIELAASWTKTMRCAVIAAEIQRNLDFLATNLRNLPERQRSMRAVFDHSWKLLTPQERSAFKRLSVFRGGFRREAAERIAGASLIILTALVDKSLLRWEPDGRYQIHELLRQYAAEQLVQSPEDVERVYDAHCAYYADFLHGRLDDMLGGRQLEATAEIKAELENIRAAWQWAVELAKVEEIQKSLETLDLFYQYQSRYLEGTNALEKAAQRLSNEDITEKIDLTLAMILTDLAWYYIRLGRLEEAEESLARGRTLHRRSDIPLGRTIDPLLASGVLALIRGDYAEATRLGKRAHQISETYNYPWSRQVTYYLLARSALLQGQYEMAQEYIQQAYTRSKEANDRWFMAYCLNEMGNVACALNDYAAAQEHYQASYALREEFNDPEGMAVALNRLGEIAILQGSYAEASQLYRQSLAIYQDIGDRGGLATSLNGLGVADCALGDYQASRQHFLQALQITTDMQFVPLTLSILIGVGELLRQIKQPERGIELVALVLHHPASEHETKERAEQLLNRYQASLSPELLATAIQHRTIDDLETVVSTVQSELAAPLDTEIPEENSVGEQASFSAPLHPGPSALVEPLTPRELEVLRLIADGLTNREIAEKLFVVIGTVKAHNNRIYGKLGVSNRVQALARARELNLL